MAIAVNIVASGTGWSVRDVVCDQGPDDRRFEECHADISIAAVTAGSFQYRTRQGAATLKLKVGSNVDDDADRVLALVEAAPDCDLILDGNQGYTPAEALELLRTLKEEDVEPILFEQPVHRHDLEGLRFVTERAGIPVAADESVQTAEIGRASCRERV